MEVRHCPSCSSTKLRKARKKQEHVNVDYETYQGYYRAICDKCGWAGNIFPDDEKDVPKTDWPIHVTVGLHGSKDGVAEEFYETFADEDVNEDEFEAWEGRNQYNYVYVGNEVIMHIAAYEDGTTRVTALECNGKMYYEPQR